MGELQAGDFRQFFWELHKRQPFPWQEALARQVSGDGGSGWPTVIDLPTGSGKTACIDIALFDLALRGRVAPRRIFFVVDRRVVVNEAYVRMGRICRSLREATAGSVLGSVADRLRELAGGKEETCEPLRVYEMRGGAFRDETWVRNPLQPTVVASTVDQVGSRLLFRGYGVNPHSWPLHAGLIASDSLIILDEAHCSLAFAQTLGRVEGYRGEAWKRNTGVSLPFGFVEMTATPSREAGAGRFGITEEDRKFEALGQRLYARKPTRLVEVKGQKDDFARLGEELVGQAIGLAKETDAKRIAIFVNRVRTAKRVFQSLQERSSGTFAVELVVGRMRAIDRDELYARSLKHLRSDCARTTEGSVTFVVSTQCLEVGADLDFDVVVSECASIDALLQRFGRLDRLGDFGRARGAIVVGSWQTDSKKPDAVYKEALAKCWEWLKHIGGTATEVNFGIESRAGEPQTVAELLKAIDATALRMPGEDAPVLEPGHVDALVQTSPTPHEDLAVELFLHGPKRSAPDVQVAWRLDLNGVEAENWAQIVQLCPPSSREMMPVQIFTFQRWLAGESGESELESDLEVGTEEEVPRSRSRGRVLLWRGSEDESKLLWRSGEIRPGQTLILPESAGGWNEMGYVPPGAAIDLGDRSAFETRNSLSLRLHPRVLEEWPQTEGLEEIRRYVAQDDGDLQEMRERLEDYLRGFDAEARSWPFAFLRDLKDLRRMKLSAYPQQAGSYVLEARRPVRRKVSDKEVFLDEHLTEVERAAREMSSHLQEGELQDALTQAALFHDYGKVDVRYQAWLRGGDVLAARYAPKPIAKSGNNLTQTQESAGLPPHYRHELLSLLFAGKSENITGKSRDLVLHLIASHHGRCRPFPPVVEDTAGECITFSGLSLCAAERVQNAPHHLGSGVADRFWRLTREHGWWGLAYLEALLRLADWKASEAQNTEVSE